MTRFTTKHHLCSRAALVPRIDNSGDRVSRRNHVRNGDIILKSLLCTAVQGMLKSAKETAAARSYWRKEKSIGAAKAQVAAAGKLACVVRGNAHNWRTICGRGQGSHCTQDSTDGPTCDECRSLLRAGVSGYHRVALHKDGDIEQIEGGCRNWPGSGRRQTGRINHRAQRVFTGVIQKISAHSSYMRSGKLSSRGVCQQSFHSPHYICGTHREVFVKLFPIDFSSNHRQRFF
ncbi:MAG: transposase [Thermoplasmata archaeon]|nr:transposase [Candidatus Sysuiplasma jiujiangense]